MVTSSITRGANERVCAAATVLFSVVNGVLVSPLPWPDAGQLIRVSETREGGNNRFPQMLTNASYLAHLFSQQLHLRMSKYIAQRRIDRAKNLLLDTDWQIKRVALECGFANPDWFSHTFHEHSGVTPTEYRQLQPTT